jgi:ribonuclease HI
MLFFFAEPLGISSSYKAELCGIMSAIEIAHQKHWHQIWLETDSSLVVMAIKNSNVVPWSLRNRWSNAMTYLRPMNFIITQIYREANQVADILTNFALSSDQKDVLAESSFVY